MVEHIAMRIINRIKQEVSAFIDESDGTARAPSQGDEPGDMLSEVKGHLGKLIAEHHQTTKSRAAAQQELDTLAAKVELAIGADRDDLARAALIRQNGLRRQLSSYDQRLKDIEAEMLEVEALIEDLSAEASDGTGNASSEASALHKQLGELDALITRKPGDQQDT